MQNDSKIQIRLHSYETNLDLFNIIIIIIISVLRHFFHVKHGLDGLLNFSLSFGRVMVWNLNYPKYPTVPNALSGIPLLVCPVKHRQLHKGNCHTLKQPNKAWDVSLLPMALVDLPISVASYDMHGYSGSILSFPNPQGILLHGISKCIEIL